MMLHDHAGTGGVEFVEGSLYKSCGKVEKSRISFINLSPLSDALYEDLAFWAGIGDF
jgi:hypothetical protein